LNPKSGERGLLSAGLLSVFLASVFSRPTCYAATAMRCPYASLIVVLCVSSCIWRSYGKILDVHLDVLTQTAAKLCAVVEAGRPLHTEDMAEYTYPSQRAREFLRQFSSYRERRSYQQLSALLDRYDVLVQGVDAARAQQQVPDLQHLIQERDVLQRFADDIRADLRAGN
jgi:hypothetical protein